MLSCRQAPRLSHAPPASTRAVWRHADHIADDVRLLLERAVPQSVDGARCVRLVPLELIFTRVSAIGAGKPQPEPAVVRDARAAAGDGEDGWARGLRVPTRAYASAPSQRAYARPRAL